MAGNWARRAAANLLPLSREKRSLARALGEWLYTGDMYDYEEPIETCQLCDHPDLRYHFEVANRFTGHRLLVGSECITRFGILAVGEDGAILSAEATARKVKRDRARLVTEGKKRSVIQSLVQLAAKEKEFDIESFIADLQDRGAFTPKQLSLLVWRLREHGIPHNKAHFKMTIRRAREKDQLLGMADWQVRQLWPCMSAGQRRFYVSRTGRQP